MHRREPHRMSEESERVTRCGVRDTVLWAGSLALTVVQLLCFIGLALLHGASYGRFAENATLPSTNGSTQSASDLTFILLLARNRIHLPGVVMAWGGAAAVVLSRTTFWCARGIYRQRLLRSILSDKSQVFLSNVVAVLWPFTAHFLLLVHLILSLALLSVYANFGLCDWGRTEFPCDWLFMVSTTTLTLSAIGTSASFCYILRIQHDFRWCRRSYQLGKPQRTSVTATGSCYTYPMHRYCRCVYRRVRNPQTAEISTSTDFVSC
ncbi:hypothetical protein AAHC03_0174 [Spirometra sp. Aus1]